MTIINYSTFCCWINIYIAFSFLKYTKTQVLNLPLLRFFLERNISISIPYQALSTKQTACNVRIPYIIYHTAVSIMSLLSLLFFIISYSPYLPVCFLATSSWSGFYLVTAPATPGKSTICQF